MVNGLDGVKVVAAVAITFCKYCCQLIDGGKANRRDGHETWSTSNAD
jgi:hypothetical protein